MSNLDLIKLMMETKAEFGYALPIHIETIPCIPNAAVAPLGIVFQDTIDEFENVKEKVCATHNQYFPFLSGMSVNDCVVEDKLAHCQYSHDALYCGCLTSITSSLHLSW